MSEKLTESITFKCTYEEKQLLKEYVKKQKRARSVVVREIVCSFLFSKNKKASIDEVSAIGEQLNSLITHISLATDTSDTFHLEPVVIPKKQIVKAQKKPNCRNQLSLIAVHSEK